MRDKLSKYDEVAVSLYERYIMKLQTDKDKDTGKPKNPWALNVGMDGWVAYFEKVAATGFYIDGDNITINYNGISLNYQAYKNLVIKKYPEATFDMQLVRKNDEFSFKKEGGKVIYKHIFTNPFGDEAYVGGYCIIKIRTGESIELLSIKDLEHIRTKAKSQNIWKEWTGEMYLKTIIKRACKRHFKDAVEVLDSMDNDNYDLSENSEIAESLLAEINACKTIKDVEQVWMAHKLDKRTKQETAALINACAKKKQEITEALNENL